MVSRQPRLIRMAQTCLRKCVLPNEHGVELVFRFSFNCCPQGTTVFSCLSIYGSILKKISKKLTNSMFLTFETCGCILDRKGFVVFWFPDYMGVPIRCHYCPRMQSDRRGEETAPFLNTKETNRHWAILCYLVIPFTTYFLHLWTVHLITSIKVSLIKNFLLWHMNRFGLCFGSAYGFTFPSYVPWAFQIVGCGFWRSNLNRSCCFQKENYSSVSLLTHLDWLYCIAETYMSICPLALWILRPVSLSR